MNSSPSHDPNAVIQDLGESFSYRRYSFSTTLPKAFRYTPGHCWLSTTTQPGLWRVGFTQFASRLLGELVEMHFDVTPDTQVHAGDVIGWYEGLKARTHLYGMCNGIFRGYNPALENPSQRAWADPHGKGWLYEVQGDPHPIIMPVQDYMHVLDTTLESMQQNNPNGCACVCALCECHDDAQPHDACDCACDCDHDANTVGDENIPHNEAKKL